MLRVISELVTGAALRAAAPALGDYWLASCHSLLKVSAFDFSPS
jgi:hypothetical protein